MNKLLEKSKELYTQEHTADVGIINKYLIEMFGLENLDSFEIKDNIVNIIDSNYKLTLGFGYYFYVSHKFNKNLFSGEPIKKISDLYRIISKLEKQIKDEY